MKNKYKLSQTLIASMLAVTTAAEAAPGFTDAAPSPMPQQAAETVTITDPATLDSTGITLKEVIKKIIATSPAGVNGVTDAQILKTTQSIPNMFKQGSFLNPASKVMMKAQIRPNAAAQIASQMLDPTHPNGYRIIEVNYRPDLVTPAATAQVIPACKDLGEGRIIVGRNQGPESYLIFEGRIPLPAQNKDCSQVQKFWNSLQNKTPTEKGSSLRAFFMDGVRGMEAVVNFKNYGTNGGQLRTNDIIDSPWVLAQAFATMTTDNKNVVFKRDTVSETPFSALWEPPVFGEGAGVTALRTKFQADLLKDGGFVDQLAAPEINAKLNGQKTASGFKHVNGEGFGINVPKGYEGFESVSDFGGSIPAVIDPTLKLKIDEKLMNLQANNKLAWPVSGDQITERFNVQTCSGCHHNSVGQSIGLSTVGGSISVPFSNDFTHVKVSGNVSQFLTDFNIKSRIAKGAALIKQNAALQTPTTP